MGLILTKNTGNGLIFIVPLTTVRQTNDSKYIWKVNDWQRYVPRESWIVINQSKFIDKRRLFKVSEVMQ